MRAQREIRVLTIAGPTVTTGYLGGTTATTKEGYLDSGDLVYADAEGRLYIAGRAKDLTSAVVTISIRC